MYIYPRLLNGLSVCLFVHIVQKNLYIGSQVTFSHVLAQSLKMIQIKIESPKQFSLLFHEHFFHLLYTHLTPHTTIYKRHKRWLAGSLSANQLNGGETKIQYDGHSSSLFFNFKELDWKCLCDKIHLMYLFSSTGRWRFVHSLCSIHKYKLEDCLQKKRIMFLHSKNKVSQKGYKGEC